MDWQSLLLLIMIVIWIPCLIVFIDIVNQFDAVPQLGITEFRPFAESFGLRLYSDPPSFYLSEPNRSGFGETPLSDWEQLLGDNMISDYVIDKIKDYLDSRPPVNYL